jgi:hypothetical protein
MIYRLIGKAVVELGGKTLLRLGLAFVRRRYRTQLRFALGFSVAALAIGAYLASREVEEG